MPEQVVDHVDHRDQVHLPADLRLRRQSHALLDLLEARPAFLVERHDLAIQDHLARSDRAAHRVHLRIARRDLITRPAHQPHAAPIDIRKPANAVPLELEAPNVVGGGEPGCEVGHHRLDALRHRLAIRILRRIHPMDHPVVASRLKKDVPAFQPLALEFDHDLTIRPLDGLVRPRVPDGHRTPPYSPLGISPANLKYSRGWSSTCTARWFFFGSGGMPLGTAHDTPTPSFSRRRSQCSRRAWCSWTTKRSAFFARRATFAPGSGVRLKSLLASYSASLRPGTRSRLGHAHRALQRRERTVLLEAAAAEASRMSPPAIKKSTVGFTSASAPDAAREIGTRPIEAIITRDITRPCIAGSVRRCSQDLISTWTHIAQALVASIGALAFIFALLWMS